MYFPVDQPGTISFSLFVSVFARCMCKITKGHNKTKEIVFSVPRQLCQLQYSLLHCHRCGHQLMTMSFIIADNDVFWSPTPPPPPPKKKNARTGTCIHHQKKITDTLCRMTESHKNNFQLVPMSEQRTWVTPATSKQCRYKISEAQGEKTPLRHVLRRCLRENIWFCKREKVFSTEWCFSWDQTEWADRMWRKVQCYYLQGSYPLGLVQSYCPQGILLEQLKLCMWAVIEVKCPSTVDHQTCIPAARVDVKPMQEKKKKKAHGYFKAFSRRKNTTIATTTMHGVCVCVCMWL